MRLSDKDLEILDLKGRINSLEIIGKGLETKYKALLEMAEKYNYRGGPAALQRFIDNVKAFASDSSSGIAGKLVIFNRFDIDRGTAK